MEKSSSKHCDNCGIETKNPRFCSKSCSAKITNKEHIRRKKTKQCKKCECLILTRQTYCKDCIKTISYIEDKTIKEAVYTKHHRSSAFALVRSRARTIAKNNRMNSCKICGYNKHVEIAHIIPISTFPEETLLSEVNDITNLVALCRNHHWEFDRGEIKL